MVQHKNSGIEREEDKRSLFTCSVARGAEGDMRRRRRRMRKRVEEKLFESKTENEIEGVREKSGMRTRTRRERMKVVTG